MLSSMQRPLDATSTPFLDLRTEVRTDVRTEVRAEVRSEVRSEE